MQWWSDFWASVGAWWAGEFWPYIAGRIIPALILIVVAVVITWILHRVIDRIVKRIVSGVKKGHETDDTQAIAQASPLAAVRVVQRTRTLGSVLHNAVNVIVFVISLLMVVQLLAPGVLGSFALLSAAVGAGLGFGAQNIVKDGLNGLFMVMEDQLGVGDVVDLGPATGVVEAVGIRVTQIRDVNGTLWYVRNGEILRVGNLSQGWARVIIDLAVPYETDVEAVEDRMLATAEEFAVSPKWRSRVLEKPQLWGLESISGDALVIRLVIKVRTSARDDVARELRIRLKRALDDMGVKLPSLNTIVLSGLEGAASVKGARPPKTKPVPLAPKTDSPTGRAPRKPKA